MTAPDAPTAMTLEEAQQEMARRKLGGIQASGDGHWHSWVQSTINVEEHDSWPEAASRVFHRPVVERDPTAELVEALEACAHALSALPRVQMYGSADMVRDRAARALRLTEAALARYRGEP